MFRNYSVTKPPSIGEIWWRAEVRTYAGYNPFAEHEDDHGPSTTKVVIDWYRVSRHTPKGVFLENNPNPIFVRGHARRQFAVPTIELALKDLTLRKQAHFLHAQQRCAVAKNQEETSLSCLDQLPKILDLVYKPLPNTTLIP